MAKTTTKKTIRAVLIDLSGTLHIGDQPIPGAREALQKLRASGRRVKFLTNTSTKSSAKLLEQLNGSSTLDFNIQRDELVTSVLATAAYVKKHKLKPLCLMEDTSDLDWDGEEEQGSCDTTQQNNPNTIITDYDSVVVGLAPSHFHYEKLNMAFRILQQYPDNLIAIHRGNYYRPAADEPLSLGPGAFITALETASQCRPAKVMGKPSRDFFESALLWEEDDIVIPREEVCMIGDDVIGDVMGARDAGIGTAILVKTGKYQPGDEEKMDVAAGDDFFVKPSIVEAIDFILAS